MRGKIALKALKTINGERQQLHGKPENSFATIAGFWETYLHTNDLPTGLRYELDGKDVALMMALLKIARIKTGAGGADSFTDAIGYIALAADMDGHGKNIDLAEFKQLLEEAKQ